MTDQEQYDIVVDALFNLRQAQVNYMADRGNNEKGKAVGQAAKRADEVLRAIGITPRVSEPKEESSYSDDELGI
jgi:hypothetical protein